MINRFKTWLTSEGYNEFWLKPHPSESDDEINKYYNVFRFRTCFEDLGIPIESIAGKLRDVDIASFNSSALLYMKKFGFTGRVISFGLDDIAGMYSFNKRYFDRQRGLFKAVGVDLVD